MNEPENSGKNSSFSASFAKRKFTYILCGVTLAYVFLYPLIISIFGLQKTFFGNPYLWVPVLVLLLLLIGVLEFFGHRKDGGLVSASAFVRAKLLGLAPVFLLWFAIGMVLTYGYDFLAEQTGSEDLAILVALSLVVVLIIVSRRLIRRGAGRAALPGESEKDNEVNNR